MATKTLETEVSKQEALSWLRNVLAGTLEVAPVSPWIKKPTRRLIGKTPDWLLDSWAKAYGADYLKLFRDCPELPFEIKTETYRAEIQQYLEARTAMPTLNMMQDLIGRFRRLNAKGKLPVDRAVMERDIMALSLSEVAPESGSFGENAGTILCDAEEPNHVLIDYQIALERQDRNRLEKVDHLLGKSGYGRWISDRIMELKRWLGFELVTTRIRFGERTPQWDALWRNVILGGQK